MSCIRYELSPNARSSKGAVVYTRSTENVDTLSFIRDDGVVTTESPFDILRMAECMPSTKADKRPAHYHNLVAEAVHHAKKDERTRAGVLGRPSSARFRAYEALKSTAEGKHGTLFEDKEVELAMEQVAANPLRQQSIDLLNRLFKSGVDEGTIVSAIIDLLRSGRLVHSLR